MLSNVEILHDTLKSCEKGCYRYHGKDVRLKLSHDEQVGCETLLPNTVGWICHYMNPEERVQVPGRCHFSCVNMDTFSFVQEHYGDSDLIGSTDGKGVLVLNMANGVHPGGSVRKGSNAQEEDLCRRSTLLQALESSEASLYYKYNRYLDDPRMGFDTMILIPKVEVFKDAKAQTLANSFVVSVLTCSAPDLRQGLRGMPQWEYGDILHSRIDKMLKCAAYFGYKHLVLGAFGCGSFRNDARVVSDMFYKVMKEFRFNELGLESCFQQIHFAVLARGGKRYNFDEFYRNFGDGNYYRDED